MLPHGSLVGHGMRMIQSVKRMISRASILWIVGGLSFRVVEVEVVAARRRLCAGQLLQAIREHFELAGTDAAMP